jgi:hypothetical protein
MTVKKKMIFFDNEVDQGLSLQKAYYIVFPTTLFIYFLYNNVMKKYLVLFVFYWCDSWFVTL